MSIPATSPSRPSALTLFLILVLPPLFWAGNFVVGRAVHSEIPPFTLSLGRWLIALCCLLPFAYPAMRRDYPLYWQYRWRLLAVSLAGVAAFNTLVYSGLHFTTATNGTLLNSCIPMLILLFGALFYRLRLHIWQVIGLALSLCGVLTIILHGEWARLLRLEFSSGDLIIFLAMVCWAFYTLWLRDIPASINRLGLMGIQIILAMILLVPLFLWEHVHGITPQWNHEVWLALAYVGIFPSVIAYTLYTLGVAYAGVARAGLFIHLMPVFGSLLSVALLGENLHLFHIVGITAILGGLFLSNRA
ncbi:Permease of the drug/metabolite transporter (DMT) superfamily [Methylobacillus rhizosphaerae]|uniref:Permease of the drug/metabolite transporter (DMT) superfamily n=1 Tax=Methylobacillus rhizosphaerae TaxID=551994 RepID=A0A238ZAM9_9PROT|nr:DMT family transporter [Methylobacillus rhizosphaerae]SNR80350.1 Permease of the drug/metabolite transporter (DMT) superfamily [Methylobacillus rhizosphaerae]